MQRITFYVCVIFLLASLAFPQGGIVKCWTNEAQKSKTTVQKVTVFQDRAMVERSGRVRIPEGDGKIFVAYLPQNIDKNSIRASAKANVKLKLSSIEIHFVKHTPESIKAIKDSIQEIDDRLAELRIQEEGLKIRDKFLLSVANLGGSVPNDKHLIIIPENLKSTSEFLKTELTSKAEEQTSISVERRELNKKRRELNERLMNLTGGKAGRGYRVEIPYKSKTAGTAEVEIKYITYNTIWFPKYDARYNEESGKVELSYYGVVKQSTGEDWDNIDLVLSTAQPHLGLDPPFLSTWYLRIYAPRPPQAYGVARGKGLARELTLEASEAEKFESLDEIAEFETARAVVSGEQVIFEVQGKQTIPADGQSHTITISELEFSAEKKFITVPRRDTRVFIIAKTTNNSDYLLLPGDISVFQGSEFLGTKYLKSSIAYNEKFELSLGSIQTIKVKFERVKEYSKKSGIIGQNKKDLFEYKITLTSNSRSNVNIEIRDHIPVSTLDIIKVEDVKFNPEPDSKNKHFQGEVIWNIQLAPSEKKQINTKFTVKYPKDKKIMGI